jgi:hypothetical protein
VITFVAVFDINLPTGVYTRTISEMGFTTGLLTGPVDIIVSYSSVSFRITLKSFTFSTVVVLFTITDIYKKVLHVIF